MINDFVLIIGLIIFFLKSLDFLYLFQTKEYRLDRLFSYFQEEKFLRIFCWPKIQIPAKSLRNILIFILFLPLVLPYFFLAQNLSIFHKLAYLLFTPILSFCSIFFLVEITAIFVYFYRQFIINKAKKIVQKSQVKFIGITGSYGKTSTKEFLYQLLSRRFRVAKTPANINTDIGVAQSIISNLQLQQSSLQYFIIEMGAYKIGEIADVCKITPPDFAILTGIGNQHLSLFGSKENLLLAKTELLRAVPKSGKIYINIDSYPLEKFQNQLKGQIVTFSSQNNQADVFIKKIVSHANGFELTFCYRHKDYQLSTKITGRHNLINLLPCLALALDLGITEEQIIKTITNLTNLPNKLSSYSGINSSFIMNDSANSNVDGFLTAIDAISDFPQKNKIILSKGIIELGPEKASSYNKIIAKLNQSNISLYTTDLLFKKCDKKNQVFTFTDENAIFKEVLKQADKNTLVLIEGKFTKDFKNRLIVK